MMGRAMASTSARTWAIKGASDRTREAALKAAAAAGLTIGEWVDQALTRAAEEARNPRPPAASREEVAEIIERALEARLQPIAKRLERLEQGSTTPGIVRGGANGTDPVASVVARLRQRRPLQTIHGRGSRR
jgi:hypothetical protein